MGCPFMEIIPPLPSALGSASFLVEALGRSRFQQSGLLLSSCLCSHSVLMCGMPPPTETPLRFVIAMALRKSLKLARGLRKQVTAVEEEVMAAELIDEIGVAGL